MKYSSRTTPQLLLSFFLISAMTTAEAYNLKGEVTPTVAPCPCPVEEILRDGLYAAIGIGYDAFKVNNNYALDDLVGHTLKGQIPIHVRGLFPGAAIGYGSYITDVLYLGGEMFVGGGDSSTTYVLNRNNLSYTAKINTRSSLGFDFTPGIKLTDQAMGYLRLGFSWVNVETEERLNSVNANKSNDSRGFDVGVGLEGLLTGPWSLRGEFTHTRYSSFNSVLHTSFRPYDNKYMMAVVYHVC